MSIYILQLVLRFVAFVVITFTSLVSNIFYGMNQTTIVDQNRNKSVDVDVTVVDYETNYQYNEKVPTGQENVLTEGTDGVIYNYNDNEIKIEEKIDEVVELGTGANGSYTGTLTAYGPDCIGCTGILACRTKEGTYQNLFDSIYYEDYQYGKVRILATDFTLFPCGTIIEITNNKLEKEIGVVLDTGSQMRKAWRENGLVWVDLALEKNDSEALKYTNYNTSYQVKRWGW